MNIKRSLIMLTVVYGLLLLASCSKHQLTDEQYVERAKNHYAQHQSRAAIIELKNALQVNPDNGAARALLGQIYVKVGDGESAEKELDRALKLGLNSDDVKLHLARAKLLQGKFQEVIDENRNEQNSELLVEVADAYLSLGDRENAGVYLAKASASQPDTISAKLIKAKLTMMQGDYDTANATLQEILNSAPDYPEAWRYLGMLAMQQTRFSDAENAFQKVIELEKSDMVSTLAIQSWLGLIQSQLAQKELEKAEQNIQKLKQKSPAHPGVDYLAALLAFEKGDFETARDDLLRVINKMPDYLPGILLLGTSQYALGNYEQADVYLSRYVNQVPSHLHARKLLAATRIKQKRSQEALELLEAAEESAPDDAQLIAMIAQASVTGGDIVKGTEYLKKAAEASPDDPSIRAELARALMGQGAFDQAIKELEAIADQYSKPRDAMLVSAHLRKKDYEAARKLAKQLTQSDPGPDTETLLGGVELISGAREKARSHFEKALTYDKNYQPALLNLGKMNLEDGNLGEARQNFDTVLVKQPNNLQAIFGLAQIADRQGDKQKALAYIEKARQADQNAALPRVILGRYYLRTGDVDKALAIAKEFQGEALEQPAIMLLAAKIYQRSGNHEKSLELLTNLAKKLPNEAGVYMELANAQANMNQLERAKDSLSKAIKIKSDFYQAKVALAQLEFRTGNSSNALKIAKQLQQQKDTASLGYTLAGDIYMQQKAYAEARQQYTKAMEQGASSALALKIATTYSKENQSNKAIAALNEWLQSHPEDAAVQMALAQEYQKQGKNDKAIQMMEAVLDKQPDNAILLNNLAWMYHLANDPRALDYAERAHQLQPNAGAITDTLGWLLVETDQQLPRAVDLLRDAVAKTPNVPEIKYHLSVALYKTNKKSEAQTILTEIVESDAQFADIGKARELLEQL
ncbi:MAG: hypothetical protein AMJ53_08580, partial [Gammaproteobacteria bacterium SG8_11]